MTNLEKEILRFVNDENLQKKDFPEPHSKEEEYYTELECWTSEKMVANTILKKKYSENEIYNAIKRLEESGKIKFGYEGRMLITFAGQENIWSLSKKIIKYLSSQWIAIVALIISIVALLVNK
ncbi:MAG: hypothetical protein Q7K54_05660 [Candidatus Parcubacteria bacterium]|nr:hypothetical protein [Candidatus Parcubacteria bacterium]